jgi:predicted nucleic acid-binding protein
MSSVGSGQRLWMSKAKAIAIAT